MANRLLSLALISSSLLCAESVQAQNIGSGRVRAASSANKSGGVFDWSTGRWRNQVPVALATSALPVYDNTCSWYSGRSFITAEECWERYDQGRLPTTDDPSIPPGGLLCNCYVLCSFEFGYCTEEAPGNVNVQLGFYEGLQSSGVGGFCTGFQTTGSAPSGNGVAVPPGNLLGPHDFYVDLTGVGLPANPQGAGTLNCWTVTVDLTNNANGGQIFCGNDDVIFDNFQDKDLFNWVWQQNGTTSLVGDTGPLLAGEPLRAAPGAGTFGISPGTDINTGLPCGTGLGNTDAFWVNVDGQPFGGGANPQCSLPPLAPGSNCYFLGGWPSNPWSGLYMRISASSTACALEDPLNIPEPYCTAKASSAGCMASIMGSDPNLQPNSGADDYNVITSNVQGLRAGIFFYGISGPIDVPFQGGTLCLNPPTGRTPVQFSQGSQNNCDGTFTYRINDMLTFNMDLGPGSANWIQTWYRDPALADGFGTALSNAISVEYQ